MAELDSLFDSLMIQKPATPDVSYVNDKYPNVLKVKETPSKGQGLFAECFLSVNDPVCSLTYPTMMSIDSGFLQTTCYHCLVMTAPPLPLPAYGNTSIELKTCNGCLYARFCSRDCQVKSWRAYHKYECKIFKKLRHNLPSDFLRAVLRIVLLKDRELLPREEWERITSLTSQEQTLAARGRSNLTEMAESVKLLAQSSMSVEMIQRLIFIMRPNAIELPSPVYGGIGVMVDPVVARLNHSCEPNVFIHRPQHTMIGGWMDSPQLSADERKTFARIVPLRDIQKGEELLNCYIVPTVSVKDRNAKLMDNYLFECVCPKCLSDTKAIADLANENPGLPAQFAQWTKDTLRHVVRLKDKPDAFEKSVTAMDKSERYLEYPVLYTTGDFPEMAMRLILEALQIRAYDQALINVLRIHFLVNPQRYLHRHNPTNIYTMFLMLQILGVILGVATPSGVNTKDKIEDWLRVLSFRGLSKSGVIYWRHRFCADLRHRLERSALGDLLVLVEKLEEDGQHLTIEDANGDDFKIRAEEEMRAVLRLKEGRWKMVLEESGC